MLPVGKANACSSLLSRNQTDGRQITSDAYQPTRGVQDYAFRIERLEHPGGRGLFNALVFPGTERHLFSPSLNSLNGVLLFAYVNHSQ